MCVCVCVWACRLGSELVVNATLPIWESTLLICHNVDLRCHNEKTKLSQRCHTVKLFAGRALYNIILRFSSKQISRISLYKRPPK